MPPRSPKPPAPHQERRGGHHLSVEWGKFRAHGEGFGIVGVILVYASPGLLALLVKALIK